MIRTTFFLVIIGLLFFSCKKDKKAPIDQLPQTTQTGQNTFGCLINGEIFLPKGAIGYPAYLYADDYNDSVYAIKAVNVNTNKRFYFYVAEMSVKTGLIYDTTSIFKPITSIGNYPLGNVSKKSFAVNYNNSSDQCQYETDSVNTGMLTITHYSVTSQKRIISGTFYFTVKNPGCPDINVTDGRFDLSF